MSGTVLDRESSTTVADQSSAPGTGRDQGPIIESNDPKVDLSLLEDRIPPQWRWSRRTAGITLLFGVLFWFYALRPVWHTDVWGHLAYGRELWATGRLAATEPLLPLAQGMPFVNTAWLAQLIGYGTMSALGVAGLQALSAALIVIAAALVWQRTWQRTRSLGFAGLALGLFLWLDAAPLTVLRPELAGLVGFCVVWQRVTARNLTRFDWVLLPALHLVWANVHGSFVLGLGLLAAATIGRAIDLLRRTGTLRSWTHDARLRTWLLLTQLSAIAALINPYGLGLYTEVLLFGQHPNLLALTEWQPLDLRDATGRIFLASVIALAVLLKLSPRRVSATEGLIAISVAVACLMTARMLIWWGPIAAVLLASHLRPALRPWLQWRPTFPPSPTAGKWTVITLGLVWICFAYSSLGMKLIHKKDPAAAKALSAKTPLGALNYLQKNPPVGQVFNLYEWGDFLQWAGPPGIQVFVNSHAHTVPRDVWLHYLQVVELQSGWEEVLDRYSVNTVIIDPEFRDPLIRRLKDDAKWKVSYEDKRSVVFTRKKLI